MEEISSSNIKLLVNYYNSNKINISEVIDYYKPTGGYLYCMFNPMYKYYGENVKKCGNTINIDKRKNQYTTSYLEESEYLLTSEQFFDKTFAETLLFYYLNDYRMRNTREFFDCDIKIVKDAFEKVKIFFDIHNSKKKLFKHLLTNIDTYYIKYDLSNTQLTKDEIINLTSDVLLNNEINDLNKIYIYDIKKNIEIRKKYLDYFKCDSNNNELICDENKFKKWIIIKCMNLLKEDFNKCIEINDNFQNDMNDNDLIEKIKTCYWFEELLNFNRYNINEIKCDDLEKIKNEFVSNVDKLYLIYKNGESKNKILKSIHYKIKSIKNFNLLQKFVVDIYNYLIKDLYFFKKRSKYVKKQYVSFEYQFIFNSKIL
jgi:hypothetical protein